MNKLLQKQIRKHFGSIDKIPEDFKEILGDINSTYNNYDSDFKTLKNSIEINSVKLQEAYQKQKDDAESQKKIIQRIKSIIASISDRDEINNDQDSSNLLDSLTKLINQQKYQEKEIRKLLLAVEQNPSSIVITDAKGNIEYANPQFCKLTGYTLDEVIGKNPNILRSNHHSNEFYKKMWQTILHGEKWEGEVLNKKKNGELYWEFSSICPVKNNNGEIINFLATKENITERKKDRDLIENQRRLFKTVIDILPNAIYVKDLEGRKILANPIDVYFSGKDCEEEVIGKTDKELYPAHSAEKSLEEDLNVIKTGKSIINVDGKLVDRNGVERSLLISKVPLYDINKKISGIVGVTYDATQQKEYEKELLDARIKAEQANNAKNEFLANVSHEIRTPLNAIIGFSEIMIDRLTNEENIYHSNIILTSAQTLLALFNDILDISKIESGQMEVEIKPMNLFELVKNINTIFQLKTDIKKIKLITEIEENVAQTIYMDERRLHQILFNIVGNAVKFTEKGHVKTKLSMTEPNKSGLVDIQFDIEDTGIGIPKDQQRKIYETFTQQSGQSNRTYGGTGLGLSISKRLTEKLNGKISLKSEVGKGTTFTILFKQVKLANDDKLDAPIQEISYNNLSFENCKVLMVDDVGFNIDIMLNLIDFNGLTFLAANSGEIALKIMEKQMPDLVLMDIRMSVEDGFTTSKTIKNDQRFQHIPIIAFASSDHSDSEYDLGQFFDDILRKPVKKHEVIELLKKYLPYTDGEDKPVKETVQEELKLSKECANKLSELISKLENNYLERWKELSGGLIIYEIEEFSNDITKLNKQYECNYITEFINNLQKAIAEFDIEKIQEKLDDFLPLIDKLKNHLKTQ